MSMSNFDIVIIGAGISGVAFARFYLEIHPTAQLAIVEEDSCVGGVWSSTRLYEEFWSQSGRRMAGFSDVPINLPPDAPLYYGTFEAKHVTKYLEDYVDSHVYSGNSIRSRINFRHRVEEVKKTDDLWTISARDPHNIQREFRSSKIVVAAGLTSTPNMPDFLLDEQEFKGPICHHKSFGEISKSLLSTSDCKNVAVLGAGKSAADMVYESVKKGKNVSWIIRRTGEGPALFFPAASGGVRYENSTEKGATRFNASFSPSSFMPNLWLARLVNGTSIGRDYLSRKLQSVDQTCRKIAAYQDREGALPSFKSLEPTTSSFWCTGPLGLAQHDDFWDTLAQNVHVFRNNISSTRPHSIVLDDGFEIPADVLLCGTGWRFNYPFFSTKQAHLLGLPHSPSEDSPEEARLWTILLEAADRRVLAKFPILKSPPPHIKSDVPTTNIRLYNCIAPLDDPSVVFLGRAHLSNSFRTAEAQAIWATAYFDRIVKMPSLEQAQREITYMNAFSKRRYPSRGAAGDFLFFELVWYTDKLMDEAGLTSHRKSWWADWVEPCLATDFKDARDEYREKYGY